MLDLSTGQVVMLDPYQYAGGWGPVGASNGSRFTWAIKKPRNAWAIQDAGSNGRVLSNTGTRSELGSFGTLGAGRSMAMAADGTLFLAGTKSISTSSCLQVQQGDQWQMITGPDGQPIPAIDVMADNAMIVFKTGKPSTSSTVNLAYATFGSSVSLQRADNVSVETSDQVQQKVKTMTSAKDELAKEIASEVDRERLKVTRESETTIFEALKLSLGEKEARKRARETAINALKASGGEHLIGIYKKSWK